MSSDHDRLAELIRSARSVVALTGAGISVPSGIPDFRSPGTGLWANVDPMEVAHISVWRRDPERFWGFYGHRFAALEGKQPNGAHRALAQLGIPVITQNIDGLHAAAGSQDVIEVHGSIASASCLACGATLPAGRDAPPVRGERRAALRLRPPAEARRRAVRRDARRGGDEPRLRARGRRRPHALHRLLARGLAGRRAARDHADGGGAVAIVTRSATPYDGHAAVRLDGDVVDELEAVLAAL